MSLLTLKVKRLHPNAKLPERANPKDAGLDVFSDAGVVIPPGDSRLVPTGISIQLPHNTEAQVRPRSGLALHHQITVLNSPGTIDEKYRGEVGVILINHSKEDFWVWPGMKIAQLVVAPVLQVGVDEVEELDDSERGVKGFGSSGQ